MLWTVGHQAKHIEYLTLPRTGSTRAIGDTIKDGIDEVFEYK
jgi:hypothetical protein